ncbi:nitrate regulatory gene2 protein-like [Musa acuminata AAA Group]|uniref:nitrate regulatory gene2 protein-like n=1 Tax=Musa acuminata AAA Group TaxID=214697 RepID=UPI0031DB117B
MGCGSSKAAAESKPVELCRERVELIRAARDLRYALAAAHAAYFRALADVGDALHRLVWEDLAPASALPASPVLVVPSSESKGKPGSVRGSVVAAAASTSSSATPLSHSLSPEGSHLPLSSGSEEVSPRAGSGEGSEAGKKDGSGNDGAEGGESSSPRQRFRPRSPDSSFMRSSTAIPTVVYQDPLTPPWSNSAYDGYGYEFGYPPYGVPIASLLQEREDRMDPSVPAVAPGTPPPPPPPATSSWDFFDPFNFYEGFFPDYSGGRYGVRFSVSSPDINEVRKQEGIPDLEEEAEAQPTEAKKQMKVVTDDLGRKNPVVGSSNTVSTPEIGRKDDNVGDIELADKVSVSSSPNSKVRSSGEDDISIRKKKGVTFEDVSYDTEKSVPSGDKPLSAHIDEPLSFKGSKDVMEVAREIKKHFRSAAGCGEEVSRMLEVGKLPYQSRSNKMYRVISSRILDPKTLHLPLSSYPSFNWSRHSTESTTISRKASMTSDHSTTGSSNISSTLEKLYLWEKKLYKDVKDEEKLRVSYDKKYKRLKDLVDRGAENYKIDSTWASVRKLRTKISIIIKSVGAFSSRIHEIRGEELQPQLIELIQGFIRMWTSLLDCHQKQLQALVDCKRHSLVMKTTSQWKSAVKVTKELELELLNWCNCFHDWISIQKSFIEALNGWQMKWLPQEQELTPDGPAPFSPTRIGAPSVFVISNDWYHAIKCVSGEKVIETMRGFTEIVHMVWEIQDEEQHQRLEEEHLSQIYDRKLKSWQAMQIDHLEIVSDINDGLKHHDDSLMALDLMKQRLDEKRAIRKETLERLQTTASNILPTGLVPTFEELGTFLSEALQAYKGIRIKIDSGGT